MRQIRVWNRALSGEELIAVAESKLTGDEENLQGYWPLDDGGTLHAIWGTAWPGPSARRA